VAKVRKSNQWIHSLSEDKQRVHVKLLQQMYLGVDNEWLMVALPAIGHRCMDVPESNIAAMEWVEEHEGTPTDDDHVFTTCAYKHETRFIVRDAPNHLIKYPTVYPRFQPSGVHNMNDAGSIEDMTGDELEVLLGLIEPDVERRSANEEVVE